MFAAAKEIELDEVEATKIRPPSPDDGAALHALISRCPPLDENSRYCNLLQVSHFADTAIVAERTGSLVGSVTGYLKPGEPGTLFVWQVAVDPTTRGQRLGLRMLQRLVARVACRDVNYLETTVTRDNAASHKTFHRFATANGATVEEQLQYSRKRHFAGEHDDEILLRIGPLRADP